MSSERTEVSDNLGQRLRSYRKILGISGSNFSSQIGISQGSLSDIETNKTKPSTKTLAGLVRNTDINIEWLLTGEGPKQLKKTTKIRKFDILNEAEEWLTEEVEKNPKREIWFEVEFEKAFQEFVAWKEEKEGKAKAAATWPASKVA